MAVTKGNRNVSKCYRWHLQISNFIICKQSYKLSNVGCILHYLYSYAQYKNCEYLHEEFMRFTNYVLSNNNKNDVQLF